MRIRWVPLVLALSLVLRSTARGQGESLAPRFHDTLRAIAAASGLAPLDSMRLSAGVKRETRIYVGFGGEPGRIIRLWEDEEGVHGRFGLFWRPAARFLTPPDQPPNPADSIWRLFDAQMVALIDTAFDCRDISQAGLRAVCWLSPASTDDWPALVATFDALGFETVPPESPRVYGRDGWGLVVEVRTPRRYHRYDYTMPSTVASNPNARAAASLVAAFTAAWRIRVP